MRASEARHARDARGRARLRRHDRRRTAASSSSTRPPSAPSATRAEEAVGREMAELIVPPRAARAPPRAACARYLDDRRAPSVLDRRIEITGMRADGSEFPVELTITRIDVPGAAGVHRLPARHHRAQAGRGRAARLARADRRGGRRGAAAASSATCTTARSSGSSSSRSTCALARAALDARPGEAARAARRGVDELARGDRRAARARARHPPRGPHRGRARRRRCDGLAARAPLPVRARRACPSERLPAPVEAAAYFVVAEALTNVARYAEASAATVEVERARRRP